MLNPVEFSRIMPLFGVYALVCVLATFILAVLLIPRQKVYIKHYAKLNCFYFFKILLTIIIVLHHIFLHLGVWNRAGICVEFFFIISGFMLFYTYTPHKTIGDFIASKLLNFMPYIFFANLLSLFGKGNIDWIRFSAGIFLFSTTPFYPHHTYYMPSWYLIVLFWVALLYFIITHIIPRKATLLISGITIFALIDMHYGSSPIEGYNTFIPWLNNGFIRGLACIGIGYCLAVFYLHQQTFFFMNNKILGFFQLGLLVYIPWTLFKQNYELKSEIEILCFVVLCSLFLYNKAFLSNIFEKSLWSNLAKFTLPTFMTHDVTVQVLIYGSNVFTPYSLAIKVFILLFASVLSGVFTYYMFFLAQICHKKIFKQTEVRSL